MATIGALASIKMVASKPKNALPCPVSEHVRFSDKCVDDLSAIGKMLQVNLWPGVRLVCLHVGEGTPAMLDDPLPHQGLREFLRWVARGRVIPGLRIARLPKVIDRPREAWARCPKTRHLYQGGGPAGRTLPRRGPSAPTTWQCEQALVGKRGSVLGRQNRVG
jgi:hypothetical protein